MRFFKKKLAKDAAVLSSAGYLNQVFHFARGFIIARLLDPTLFGYLSGTRLILEYLPVIQFGALPGMSRYLSIYKGAEDKEKFLRTSRSGISITILLTAMVTLGIIIYTFFVQDTYSPYTIWGIRVFALAAFVQQMISICQALLRVDYHFSDISISNILLGFSSLILAIVLVLWIGLYGAILSFLIAHILSLIYLTTKVHFEFKFDLNRSALKKIFSIGFPISLVFINMQILNGLDRIMILKFLTVKQLGYYAIAFPFFRLLTMIPHSLSYITFPKMLEAYGSSLREIKSTKRYFEIPTQVNSFIIAAAIGMLFLSIKYIFHYLLPQYTDAVMVSRILVFTVFFSGINMLARPVLITDKRFKALFFFQGIAILINICLNYTLIKLGYGINGVAVATALASFIYSFLILHYTLSMYYQGFFVILFKQIKLYWPIFYTGLLLLIIFYVRCFNTDIIRGIGIDIFYLAINISVFSLLTVPLFIFLNRRTIKGMVL